MPSARASNFAHERVTTVCGERSGLSITVAVHSTALGPALGGCRLWAYESWEDGLADALRLSDGMTAKNALAGLRLGGGKTVVRLEPGQVLDDVQRRAAFLDVGELVESFGGSYITAEDVGTSAEDMAVIAERTTHVVGLPTGSGGLGDPGEYTARGVYAALRATMGRVGLGEIAGTRITIAGLGHVGGRLAQQLASQGARLTLTDVNPARERLAGELGAAWSAPGEAHRAPADIFMPAGVGGMLSARVIAELDCAAVVGPANNQLAEPGGAEQLAHRGILYAPDYVVNAGGVIFLGALSEEHAAREEVLGRIDGIGATLEQVYDIAEREHVTPLDAATQLVAERLRAAGARLVH